VLRRRGSCCHFPGRAVDRRESISNRGTRVFQLRQATETTASYFGKQHAVMCTSEAAILAAGGIVVRHDADGYKIAVVERKRYPGEIALPKGKVNADETILQAAEREIFEETGCTGKNPTFAGTVCYFPDDKPKIVFFYKMELASENSTGPQDPDEITHVEWMRPLEAVQKLTHKEARRLVTDIFGLLPTYVRATESVRSRVIGAWWAAFGSAERDRLADNIAETRIELEQQILGNNADVATSQAAYRYLIQAEDCLRCSNLQRGWVNLHLARRAALANLKDFAKANRVAMSLRQELDKITGWRSKAISGLICNNGQLRHIASPEGVRTLADAAWLRDDYANNSYFKILLRRRHLLMLFLLLVLAVLGCLFKWPVGPSTTPLTRNTRTASNSSLRNFRRLYQCRAKSPQYRHFGQDTRTTNRIIFDLDAACNRRRFRSHRGSTY
jgi:8-oxo-dGTP pyrophosphatase MutT (NUDIX family)